jgi:regulator of replication initiation timing
VNPDNQPGVESKTLSEQLEEAIAECAYLKMENEKLRKDLNAAVMYSIQNQRQPIQKPSRPNWGIA